jgi:hypothetical protein
MFPASAEQQKKLILIGFIAALFVHLVFVFANFYNNDDINYARYAAGIVNNGISFTPSADHYQLRWTSIFTSAFFFKLFGINSFASTLCSFISIVLCSVLLKKIMAAYKPVIYLLSLTLFFFAHSILFYMHRLLPDPAMCFAVLWMYTSYRSYYLQPQKPAANGIQFSLALLLAIITKETIIIALPLFASFFIIDIIQKKRLQFWLYATATTIIMVMLYLLYFKITTGSFFYRYTILQSNNYFTECSFDQLPFSYTLKRIGYQLWNAMLLNGDMLLLLPAVAAVIYKKRIQHYAPTLSLDFYSFLFLLCAANFMSISFTTYVPLCHDPRHFLFLFPFAAVIAGPMLYAYFKAPAQFVLLPIFLAIATGIIFYLHGGTTKYLYLLFTVLLLARLIVAALNKSGDLSRIFVAAIFILFAINYCIDFIKPPYPYYWDHKKVVERSFAGKAITATIFSADAPSGELTEFFLHFKTGRLQVLPIDSAKPVNSGNLYYLLVGDINGTAKEKADSIFNTKNQTQWILVDKEKNVFLYQLDDSLLQLLKQ